MFSASHLDIRGFQFESQIKKTLILNSTDEQNRFCIETYNDMFVSK